MAHSLDCPRCGAPLPPRARRIVVVCGFCAATVSLDGHLVRRADFHEARVRDEDDRAARDDGTSGVFVLGGEPYVVGGRLGTGASSDVFWGFRARRNHERVVIKVLRASVDADLFEHEWDVLGALASSSARGSAHFGSLVPERVATGELSRPRSGADRRAHVFRLRSGFVPSLERIADVAVGGFDARHVVWIWRRLLEVLAWTHDSGFVHAAVLPEHVIVHPRDHGVMLIGWSVAERAAGGAALRAAAAGREHFYPRAVVGKKRPLGPWVDLVMAARTVRFLVEGQRLPDALGALLGEVASNDGENNESALALAERVRVAALAAYGPPTFVRLEVPTS